MNALIVKRCLNQNRVIVAYFVLTAVHSVLQSKTIFFEFVSKMDAKQTGMIGGLFALPWCCIIPTIFSVLGLAGVVVAREVTGGLAPYLLVLSVLFLGRAHYLLYIKHHGNRVSHIVTWAATLLALTLWGVRWIL